MEAFLTAMGIIFMALVVVVGIMMLMGGIKITRKYE
jgi:hypothetical protein